MTEHGARPGERARFLVTAALLALGVGAVAAGGVGCARTDQKIYAAGQAAHATFHNRLPETLYLPGCAPFVFERSLDGEWVEGDPPYVCVWEGIAVPVESGESVETPFDAPPDSGLYRLRYEVGLRCESDQPLSEANCEMRSSSISNEFEVERELCEPEDPDCRFVPAAPNRLCDDGVHYSGPSSECTRDPSSGRCGYEFLRCP